MARIIEASPSIKIKMYRKHDCAEHHRDAKSFCECSFETATSIAGQGQFVVLKRCVGKTLSLWPTYRQALDDKEDCDRNGCGPRCIGNHEVVFIDLMRQFERRPVVVPRA